MARTHTAARDATMIDTANVSEQHREAISDKGTHRCYGELVLVSLHMPSDVAQALAAIVAQFCVDGKTILESAPNGV
jgi:hypothetical protein